MAFGTATLLGMVLILIFDFLSHLNTPFFNVASLLNELSGWQYLISIIFTFIIIIFPIDSYYILWGTTAIRDVPLVLSLELLFFFGIVGIVIGYRSKGTGDAILNSFLFVLSLNVILIILILLLNAVIPIGDVLASILGGITGKDMVTFVVTSSPMERWTATEVE